MKAIRNNKLITLVISCLMLSACTTSILFRINYAPEDYSDRAIVYGYISADDSNGGISGFQFEQISPEVTKSTYIAQTLKLDSKNGDSGFVFFQEFSPKNATLYMVGFYDSGFWGYMHSGSLVSAIRNNELFPEWVMEIGDQDVYYVGSFSYRRESRSEFVLEPSRSKVSKREMLRELRRAFADNKQLTDKIDSELGRVGQG